MTGLNLSQRKNFPGANMKDYTTRQTLLEKIRLTNDDQTWEDFSHYYGGFINAVLRSMGFDFHDCEDLRQIILIKARRRYLNGRIARSVFVHGSRL